MLVWGSQRRVYEPCEEGSLTLVTTETFRQRPSPVRLRLHRRRRRWRHLSSDQSPSAARPEPTWRPLPPLELTKTHSNQTSGAKSEAIPAPPHSQRGPQSRARWHGTQGTHAGRQSAHSSRRRHVHRHTDTVYLRRDEPGRVGSGRDQAPSRVGRWSR